MFSGLKDLANMAPEGRHNNKKVLIKAEGKNDPCYEKVYF